MNLINRLHALYAQWLWITLAPLVLPLLLARELAGASFSSKVIIYLDERVLQLYYLCLHHSRNIAGSSFRRVSNIPHCCILMDAGPFLSSSVADHSLKPTKDLRLGKLLPHQLSNPKQANFVAIKIFLRSTRPPLSEHLSRVYNTKPFFSRLQSIFLSITHPSATLPKIRIAFNLHVLSILLAFILSQDQTLFFFFFFPCSSA